MSALIFRSTPLAKVEHQITDRTVTAYAAVFNQVTDISDQDGVYREQINPKAFNRTLAHKGKAFQVLTNHGKTLYGTPSDRFSLPVAVIEHLEADSTGLLSVCRYLDIPLGDEMLVQMREGTVGGYSWSGRVEDSSPVKPRGGYTYDRSGMPQLVTRNEIALLEFGPTPFPAYQGAGILTVGGQSVGRAVDLSPDAALLIASVLESAAVADSALDYWLAPLQAADIALDQIQAVLASMLDVPNPDTDDPMDGMDRTKREALKGLSTRLTALGKCASTSTPEPAATGDSAEGHSRPATDNARYVRSRLIKMGLA